MQQNSRVSSFIVLCWLLVAIQLVAVITTFLQLDLVSFGLVCVLMIASLLLIFKPGPAGEYQQVERHQIARLRSRVWVTVLCLEQQLLAICIVLIVMNTTLKSSVWRVLFTLDTWLPKSSFWMLHQDLWSWGFLLSWLLVGIPITCVVCLVRARGYVRYKNSHYYID
jgi:hypothetical protein